MGCSSSPKEKESSNIVKKNVNKSSDRKISNIPHESQNKNRGGGCGIYFSSSLYQRTHKEIPKDASVKNINDELYIGI